MSANARETYSHLISVMSRYSFRYCRGYVAYRPDNRVRFRICRALFRLTEGLFCSRRVTESDSPQTGVVLTKLVQPISPPTARATRTTGDVDLLVTIRQDGAVGSVVVLSGHPLLKESAVTSAQKSQFECRGCTEQLTKYRLVYTFEIEGECKCEPKETQSTKKEPEQAYPRISDAQHRVTVVAHILCICDPAASRRVRSLKCLYLWKCGETF
jgi:Gram-negative bacterial TonB protein C-terminal